MKTFAVVFTPEAQRDEVRPGLRVSNCERRTVIAFEVDEAAAQVAILGVFYGGRDYETALAADTGRDE